MPDPTTLSGATAGDLPVGADSSGERVDGRRARRDRNRQAVVDAVLELLREGNLRPSTDEIAARAGLSPRSLFRYFEDVDDLFGVAIRTQSHFFRSHLPIDVDPTLPVAGRVSALVAHRVALYEAIAGVGIVARANEPFRSSVRAELTRFRALVRDQLRALLADDLLGLDPALAERRLTSAEVLTSFETYRLLRDDRGLHADEAAAVMIDGVLALVAEHPTDAPTSPQEPA